MQDRLVLIGGGGHALVVASLARGTGWRELLVYDDQAACSAVTRLGLVHAGRMRDIPSPSPAPMILALGDLRARRTLLQAHHTSRFANVIAPEAILAPAEELRLGVGIMIGRGTVVQPYASIAHHCILNTACIIEHECELGENVHVAPGAVLGGNVRVGRDTLVGLGARILPGVCIGHGCTIGAGAVVTRDVPDETTVVGVPARTV